MPEFIESRNSEDIKIEVSQTQESLKEVEENIIKERTKKSLNDLKKDIESWVEPSVTKGPEKTSNGKVLFDYEKNGQKWEIVVGKSWNTYETRIKKRINNQWHTQKFWKNETYNFTASDKLSFNKWLWVAMDKIIGSSRDRLPNTGWKVYEMLNSTSSKETKETYWKTDLKKKPIDLHYKEKNKERKLENINYPKNEQSVEWRITRCLRFASITDAVEDRYWIPRWLLMALMAQEWWWDPTVINLNGDWGAGLIHIQAINAAEYWMKTLPRFKWKKDKKNQIDYKHGAKLKDAKKNTNNNLRKLSEMDDRFNPIMGIDVSARFLMGDKWWRNAKTWDDWIRVANRYAWRWMSDYWYSVLVYWTTINKIRWNKMPAFKDKEINKVINWQASAKVNGKWERTDLSIDRTKKAVENLRFTIDWTKVSSQEYYKYLQGQWDNYGLSDYIKYNKEHPYKK